jgi:predicted outer membrane repeat protein
MLTRRRATPALALLCFIGGTLTLATPAQAAPVSCMAGTFTDLQSCLAAANNAANVETTITILNDMTATANLTAVTVPSTSTLAIDGNSKTLTLGSWRGFNIDVLGTGRTVTINNLFTSGGASPDDGGALLVRGGRLSANNLRIQGATANQYGGGIALYDAEVTHTISRSVISGNTATTQSGGGIYAVGALTLANSTVYNNTATSAGGVSVSAGSLAGISSLQFSTITGNNGGNFSSNVDSFSIGTKVRLIGTVVSNPLGAAARNCRGSVLSASYSVIGNTAGNDTSCGTAATNQLSLATTSAIALGTFSSNTLVPANASVLVNGAPDALGTGITTDQTFATRSGAFTIGAVQVSVPAVSASPSSGSFGTVSPGTTSSTTTFTITNSGSSALAFGAGAATLSGSNASDFAITSDTCSSASVAIGASCTVAVTFTPGANGARSASLVLASNAPSSPQSIALSGTGGSSSGGSSGGGSTEPTPTPTPTATPSATPTPTVTVAPAVPVTRTVAVELRFQRGTARLTRVSQGRITALAASVPARATGVVVRVVAVDSTTSPSAAQESLTRQRSASVTAALRAAGLRGTYESVVRLPRGPYRDLAGQASATVVFTS